ncbi:nuclear transport factor 2 family protein [Emticicia sp. C21]|uniref:nuclear transport factor 2 family protein n=1 Tax=Emticicia sp. C21 TaxID=2302915 RepID=UPI000E3526F0|nr:nuclear transport factor 2 family protein [Emticicia sp. C21]RFS15118.1 nuclear transport factor 2 family protein [Emticicia sp. C21]
MQQQEQLIQHYIKSYNNFDVEGMLRDLDENVQFENISGGEVNMSIQGLSAFRDQAEKAKAFFSDRQQLIKSFQHKHNQTEIEIDYHVILAIDLPNGLKKGDALDLKGKSVFTFNNLKIIAITDIS